MYALVDCNNFFVSCERAFRPDLENKPVVVLSNNDGCVISRSAEVKALGISMGEPYFKCKELLEKNGVVVFSSNYELYGDISNRVMSTLEQFTDGVEVYSIDEAFLDVGASKLPPSTANHPSPLLGKEGVILSPSAREGVQGGEGAIQFAQQIRDTVRRWTRIPVSIGIAPTKVLAKAASHIAKKNPAHQGVFELTSENTDRYLNEFAVADLWGIGRQSAMLLWKHRINTALELKNQPDAWIKKKLTVRGLELVYELRGRSCFKLDEAPTPKKGITCSRSFGTPVKNIEQLAEAVATYTARAAEKLRHEGLVAAYMSVYIRTSRFTSGPRYNGSEGVLLPVPTAFTPQLLSAALGALKKIYRPGFSYAKAGVNMYDLRPKNAVQQNLFEHFPTNKQNRLMTSVDLLNRRFGAAGITYGAMGTKQAWRMKRSLVSPRFTTNLKELPIAR